MGKPESKYVQFVSAIKSDDQVTVHVTLPSGWYVTKTFKYDEQTFKRPDKTDRGQMLVQLDEKQWPESLPYGWGVGTGMPELEITVTWKKKICKFVHNRDGWDIPRTNMGLLTFRYYIYEDGVHVGAEPNGIFWGKYKDKRPIIGWKDCDVEILDFN